jgi:uncharacterized protein (DUF2132 family)
LHHGKATIKRSFARSDPKNYFGTIRSYFGFDTLGEFIPIKCFTENPSIKSSLTFLKKTDWARASGTALHSKL